MKMTTNAPLRIAQYERLFLRPTDTIAGNGKTVYINAKFHDIVSRIVLIVGSGNISVTDYLHNVLEYHFQDFGAEIKSIYNSRNTSIL